MSEPRTNAEHYLASLCQRTFLSLWTAPSVFRDQADGQEICDLLVVFGEHVLIFSDKDCVFPNTGDLRRDWCRWFSRSIKESVKQLGGATRWIRKHPDRIFLEQSCAVGLPFALARSDRLVIHRIAVTHNSADRCRIEIGGGSGSLFVNPNVVGSQHHDLSSERLMPFHVGAVDPDVGFVHVLDDVSLDALLETLDTAPDFIDYLTAKERLIDSGRLAIATGEEDLLAYYLMHKNADGRHDFALPDNFDRIAIDEIWDDFIRGPLRKSQLDADAESYAWDGLIERFIRHARAGIQNFTTHLSIREKEHVYRALASERRTVRRGLVKCWMSLMKRASGQARAIALVPPTPGNSHAYAFLVLRRPEGVSALEYRRLRLDLVSLLCGAAKNRAPQASAVVGIACDPVDVAECSEDLVYLDTRDWDVSHRNAVELKLAECGILQVVQDVRSTELDYPIEAGKPAERE